MSSLRLPGEAGIVQQNETAPALDIVPDHLADLTSTQTRSSSDIFDRLHSKLSAAVAVGVATVALLVCPTFQEQANAATTKVVEIGMPFGGRWGSTASGQANTHTVYSGNWAEDLFANDTEVKLNVFAPNGEALSFDLLGTWDSCGGKAGKGIRIGIKAGSESVGWVSYTHLDGTVTSGAITNGMVLGKTKKWDYVKDCWEVETNEGVHAHFEAKSDSGNYACYKERAVTTNLSYGDTIAKLGATGATGSQQSCSTGSGGGGTPTPPPAPNHYADYMIYRYDPNASTGFWYAKSSSTGSPTPVWGWAHGSSGDKPIAADFDGDGYDDYGIYRNGYWYVRSGGSGQEIPSAWGVYHGGWSQDIPVAGDFDGDGKADFGIYRMESDSTGRWYVKSSKPNNPNTPVWGWAHGSPGDVPVVGDFNGDNVDDYGIYRNGTWYVRSGGDGNTTPIWGSGHGGWSGDRPIVGDFNGDNIDDFGIYRVENGTGYWYVKSGHNGQQINAAWGVPHGGWSQDVPLAGDFGAN